MKEKDEELIKTKTLLGSPTLSFNVFFFIIKMLLFFNLYQCNKLKGIN